MSKDAYDCGYKVPGDGVIDGYSNLENCTCTYCDNACTAPAVNGEVGFFDGCNGLLVGIIYAYVFLFSIVLAVFRNYCEKKKRAEHLKKLEQERKNKDSGV